jgi:hypothetical protein
MTNARETEFQTGDETLGGKRNWGRLEMPVLPPIFDTTLGLGATGPRAT